MNPKIHLVTDASGAVQHTPVEDATQPAGAGATE